MNETKKQPDISDLILTSVMISGIILITPIIISVIGMKLMYSLITEQ